MRPGYSLDDDPRIEQQQKIKYARPQGGPAPIDQPGGVTIQPGGGLPMIPKRPGPFPPIYGGGIGGTPTGGGPLADIAISDGSMKFPEGGDLQQLFEEMMNRQGPRGGGAPPGWARMLGGVR